MGAGIAQASALAGYEVQLYDLAGDLLAQAMNRICQSIDNGVVRGKTEADVAEQAKAAIRLTTSLADAAQSDLVIEAVPETLELKREIFTILDDAAPEDTILASNTSSLSINVLAASTQRQDKFLGVHFFNPAHIMKLVELIPGPDTLPDVQTVVS